MLKSGLLLQDSVTKNVFTNSTAEPDFIPETDGRVRVPVYIAEYQLTPTPNGQVDVSYRLRLDPGGKIPDWMVNLFIIKGPYESTLKMRERIETGKYNGAKFSFLKEKYYKQLSFELQGNQDKITDFSLLCHK